MTPPEGTPIVLLVDDDPDTRAIVARMLVPVGVNVLEAANGRQALSILKKQKVDVVLSDLVMPRMSGLMLLHSMLEAGHHMPFILMTGYSDKDSAIQALRLGAFDYLEKPLHESDLESVTTEAIKVSREQQAILSAVQGQAGMPGNDPADRSAEFQIMRMRTFRFKNDGYDFAVSRDNIRNWHDLKELFVQEAEPQLTFSEGALAELAKSDKETLARDLAFVLRVIQSVRIASEAIRLNDIAEFAWTLESTVAVFKNHPETLSPEHVDLMVNANRLIREKVAALASPEASAVHAQLADLAEAIRKQKTA